MLLCNVIQLLITVGDLDHDLDLSLGSSATKRSDPDSTENERSSKTDPWLGDWRMPSIKDGVCVPTTCHCSWVVERKDLRQRGTIKFHILSAVLQLLTKKKKKKSNEVILNGWCTRLMSLAWSSLATTAPTSHQSPLSLVVDGTWKPEKAPWFTWCNTILIPLVIKWVLPTSETLP